MIDTFKLAGYVCAIFALVFTYFRYLFGGPLIMDALILLLFVLCFLCWTLVIRWRKS